ncbi:hypothetical protein PanWU01x14_169700, partial [Parasponia andersonii]
TVQHSYSRERENKKKYRKLQESAESNSTKPFKMCQMTRIFLTIQWFEPKRKSSWIVLSLKKIKSFYLKQSSAVSSIALPSSEKHTNYNFNQMRSHPLTLS